MMESSPLEVKVEAVFVGAVETFELADGDSLTSAIRKRSRTGASELGVAGFVGDECQHPSHGGPNRAVHVFAAEHYDRFAEIAGHSLPQPLVGENSCIRGYPDDVARVGDHLRIGSALAEVTMPTERCRNPGRLHQVPQLLRWMIEELRTGFYLKVLEPGSVRPGDACVLEARGPERWTIQSLSQAMYRQVADAELVAELQRVEPLAPEWKERLAVLHARRTRT
ncbi:MAG: MOSC domain-containing protein [Myxococcales bacterium]|nr:MOSC domain-containing protein [Myxococcales bacterium]